LSGGQEISMKTSLIIIALACLLLLAATLATSPAISWHATTGGGGHYTTGIYTLDSAPGQPFVGTTSTSPYELCSGYLCTSQEGSRVNLPMIKK
jgi:hypothetical protein